MLQYILTGLAGIALGIVGMRIWLARESAAAATPDDPAVTQDAAGTDLASTARSALSTRNMLAGAGALALGAAALFMLPSPESAPAAGPSAPAPAIAAGQDVADVDTMITRLARRLESAPDDGEGFRMLGWSYVMTGKPEQAIEPYRRALTLLPGRANVHAGYGEALVAVAKDTVTPQARAAFDKAVAIDPTEPRARYFLALWQAQNGQEAKALDAWIALANGGPADAPWQADVRRRIAAVATRTGVSIDNRLKPGPAALAGAPVLDSATLTAASALSESDRQGMVDGMVDGLATKLRANPANAEGWAMLLRSRMVLKQDEQAGADLATARKALAGNNAGLAQVNAAATQLGVPGA